MKLRFIVICSFLFLFQSCKQNNEPEINTNNLLLGNWSDAVYDGETTSFKRVATIGNESYGVTFRPEGLFIERSSGWCGTPPLVFSNFEGNFKNDNSIIEITTDFFPGNYNWRIVELTAQNLVVKRELSEQEKDHRALMDLFNEIENLAYSISCTDANDWKFSAYGSKACGGPQGYIPYNIQIDTVAFLQKIDIYTQAEQDYNINWGIISTCDIPNQPIAIVCENSFPSLKY